MKTLLILRHAKSSWDAPSADDFSRPLNDRGIKTAPLMGKLIKKEKLVPEVIFSSPAARAIQTAQLIAQSVGFLDAIQKVPHFYPGEPKDYIQTLNTRTTDESIAMVIGHNPGLESLLKVLIGHKEALPTAALAQVQLPIDHWSQLTSKTKGVLIQVFRPKEIFEELADGG